MGKIEKILKKGSVEGQTTEVYPVTSTKAVYDENNKRLDNIITGLQESVYDVVYKNKLTPVLKEIDIAGTDADRKAKLDQFAVDWKALTGADTLDGAKFVGYSGEPDNFWGIFIYNSSIEGYSAIATSAHLSTYQVIILSTGTIISNSLFYHVEPVIIRTSNTDSDMAKNVDAIQEYVNNLTYLGVYIYLGFTMPVTLIDDNTFGRFGGYLFCEYHGGKPVLSGTVFFKDIIKNIVIDGTGRYTETVKITGTNPLNTTSDNMVDAINEVNTLAKSKGNGTITEVRMNRVSKGTSGVVDLGTVITAHQDISGKQDKLISGTNIKTINGESVLGSGDITISGGASSSAYPEVNHGTGDTTFTLTNSQLVSLTAAGIVTFRESFTKGIVVTDGITMAPADSAFRRLSTTRNINSIEDLIRQKAEPFIGKQNNDVNRNSLRTAITAALGALLNTLIQSYTLNLNTDENADQMTYIDIDYTIRPINEIREVRNTIKVQNGTD